MNTNPLKPIIFLCLMVLLNACGIGHYHHLNLVRPDKKNSIALVKPKHKTNKVTETIIEDSTTFETTKENDLTNTSNAISEKTETLANAFLKKPSHNAKKIKIGLKEKVMLTLLKNNVGNRINFKKNISFDILNSDGVAILLWFLVLGFWLIIVPALIILVILLIIDTLGIRIF